MSIITLTILTYLVITFIIAWYFSRHETLEDYFVNKRNTGLFLLLCSNVATLVGAGATVGFVAEVSRTGIGYGVGMIFSLIFGSIILGIVAPKIKSFSENSNTITLFDFFRSRFNTINAGIATIIILFLTLSWLATQMNAMASLASSMTGLNYRVSLLIGVAITIVYTSVGGIKIDIITDFLQFWTMAIVFIVMGFLINQQMGGYVEISRQLPTRYLDPLGFGGASWLIGVIILSGFIYLSNPSHWQRIVAAKNSKVARLSFLGALPLILILSFLMIYFGLAAVTNVDNHSSDRVIFDLMEKSLHSPWLLGAGYAAVFATIMSTVDSLMIGGSTIIHKLVFPEMKLNSKYELLTARSITALFGIVATLIALYVPSIVTLTLLCATLALVPLASILGGLYSSKISSKASLWGLLGGSLVTLLTFPFYPKHSFIFTTLVSFSIVFLYDKFRRTQNNVEVNKE